MDNLAVAKTLVFYVNGIKVSEDANILYHKLLIAFF